MLDDRFLKFSSKTSVHLSVDTGVTDLDLEGTVVSPGSVPGVNSEPVVLSVFVSPSDNFDSVTSEGVSTSVLIDSTLVGKEIFVYSEGSGDGTEGLDISLNLLDGVKAKSIAGGSHVFVFGVVNAGDSGARAVTRRLDLLDGITLGERRSGLMVVALGHGVIVAEFIITEVSSRNDTLVYEPFPGSSNLTTVASHRLAL